MGKSIIDLTGQRFGHLTVIERAQNKGKQIAWLCKCDCGKEVIVARGNLRSGHTKSCGCLREDVASDVHLCDLTGQKFGRLTVISRAESTNKNTTWKCRCDCGKMTVVSGSNLKNGHTKSCGCYARECASNARSGELTGEKFGRLVVVERYGSDKWGNSTWRCECECGGETIVPYQRLVNGETKSCGCLRIDFPNHKTHGGSNTRLYKIYANMKARCYNPRNSRYYSHGARGVIVCSDWLGNHGVENFIRWAMTTGYRDDLSLDRIDNDGIYCPENCRWATNVEQANNKRNTRYVVFNGTRYAISELARLHGMSPSKLYKRHITQHWSLEKTLNTP